MNIRSWLGVGVCVGLFGCDIVVDTTPLNEPPHALAPRSKEAVEVFSSVLPSRPHQDIALIQAEDVKDVAVVIDAMRARAGEMGCDAIFISGLNQRPAATGGGLAWLAGTLHSVSATCVVWLASPNTAAVAASASVPAARPAAPSPRAAAAHALSQSDIDELNRALD